MRAKDYVQRYHCLLTSVDTYVHHMQDSIPVWKEFNDQYHGISEWLNHVDGELCSEHTQPGNVSVTERSLENSEVCGHWSYLGTDFWLTTFLYIHARTHTPFAHLSLHHTTHSHHHPHTHTYHSPHHHTHTLPPLQGLLHDIQDHQETLVLLRTTTKTLCRLCIPEDQAIVQGRVEEVEGEMGRASEQTSSRIEELEQRLKSWEVSNVHPL